MKPLRRIINAIRNLLYPFIAVRDVPHRINQLAKRLEVERDRRSRVLACREMFDTDPRCEGLIDKLASDAVRGGFTLKVENSSQAQKIADDLVNRLNLFLRLDDWLVMAQRDGDLMLELSLSGKDIVGVTRKPSLEMHRHTDETDQFIDPERAYWQAEELWHMSPPNNSVWFADWQIIHARWNHNEGDRYGRPQFSSAVGSWKKLVKGEENVTIRRMVRSGMRLYHYVAGGFPAIAKYREENQVALDNPAEAAIDYFGNTPEGPKVLEGDPHIAEIGDIKHLLHTFVTGTPVPLAALGYADDLNRDILEDQWSQYELALPGVAQWVETQILKPLLEIQWLLYGIFPPVLDYEIVWKRDELAEAELDQQQVEASKRKAEAISQAAEAGQKLISLGWTQQAVAKVMELLLTDAGLEVKAQLETQNTPDRLAMIALRQAQEGDQEESHGTNNNGSSGSQLAEMEW